MASDSEACCESDPNFAVICGFLEKFGVSCGLTNIDFLDLQDMLENNQEVPQELVDLHVKLLRKARKSVSSERWERAIIKFCHGFCSQDAWEIERFGYKKARLSSKLRILKELLEIQFDYNVKFKNEVNKLSAEELRTQPLGRDQLGHIYWFQSDNSCQIRVYKEDPDEETWALVAKNREGLVGLITQLNDGNTNVVNEDSNSLESEKPTVDTGQTDSNSNSSKIEQPAMADVNTEQLPNNQNADEDTTFVSAEITATEPSTEELDKFEIVSTLPTKIDTDYTNGNTDVVDDVKEEVNEINKSDDTETEQHETKVNLKLKVKKNMIEDHMNEVSSEDSTIKETMEDEQKPVHLQIRPIPPDVATSAEMSKKLEVTGVKEKYIRSDSTTSSVPHRKAVDSAGFDVHTNYLKRPPHDEEDIEEPSYLKRPRIDRPTLLGNKRKKSYSDEDEVSDEITEPLMLVKGEGNGQENNTENPLIVSEAIEESVMYFCGEGAGFDCETGNEQLHSQNSVNNQVDSASSSSTQAVTDAVESVRDNENTNSHIKFKLGTIIDVRSDHGGNSANNMVKASRWDKGKPSNEDVDSSIQCNTENSPKEIKSEDATTSGKSMFFFGPGSLQVKPVISPIKKNEESVSDDLVNVDNNRTVGNLTSKITKDKPRNIVGNRRKSEKPVRKISGSDLDCKDMLLNKESNYETSDMLKKETIVLSSNLKSRGVELQSDISHSLTTTNHVPKSITSFDEKGDSVDNNFVDVPIGKSDCINLKIEKTVLPNAKISTSMDKPKSKLENVLEKINQGKISKKTDGLDLSNKYKNNNLTTNIDSKSVDKITYSVQSSLVDQGSNPTKTEISNLTKISSKDVKSIIATDISKDAPNNSSKTFDSEIIKSELVPVVVIESSSKDITTQKNETHLENSLPHEECSSKTNTTFKEDIPTLEDNSLIPLPNQNSTDNDDLSPPPLEREVLHHENNCISTSDQEVSNDKVSNNKNKTIKDLNDKNKKVLEKSKSKSESESKTKESAEEIVSRRITRRTRSNADSTVTEAGEINKSVEETKSKAKQIKKKESHAPPEMDKELEALATNRELRERKTIQQPSKDKPKPKVIKPKKEENKKNLKNVKEKKNAKSQKVKDDNKSEEVNEQVANLKEIEEQIVQNDTAPPKKAKLVGATETASDKKNSNKPQNDTTESELVDDDVIAVEPVCVQKKVPLLTDDEKNGEEVEKQADDQTCIEVEDEDSSDIMIVPDSDPLACSEDESKTSERVMTLATFKIDLDETDSIVPMRVTRKRAAQQSVDTLRDSTNSRKKVETDKKDASKKPKLKRKRSTDQNLRRSVEAKKSKEISSSDDDNPASPVLIIEEEEANGTSNSINERRESNRSSSPIQSSGDSRTEVQREPKEKKPKKMRKTLLGLEISEETENLLKEDAPMGVRQSRRIAQIKIKEEAERRKLEEMTLHELKEEKIRKGKKDIDKDYKLEKKRRNKNLPTEDETTTGDGEFDEKKKRKKKRKHRDPRKQFDVHNPWKSSSGSSSSEEEEEEEDLEEDDDRPMVLKSDHEFSPESDLEGVEVQPLKRARTARKESDAEEEVDHYACQKCGQSDHPEWILLCDSCDSGWHCSCLRPALLVIPEGDWFCPPCQHVTLVKKLEVQLVEYDKRINKKVMETRRKERLAYVGISLDNVLPSKDSDEHRSKTKYVREHEDDGDSEDSETDESGSESDSMSSTESDSEPIYQLRKRRQAHSYRFNDYDDLINSAIQDELDAVKGAGNQGRGKDISTIVNAEKQDAQARLKVDADNLEPINSNDLPTDLTMKSNSAENVEPAIEPLPPVVPPDYDKKPDNEESEDEIIRPVRKIISKKKHRKLNSLDVSSGDDAESDEDFKGSSTSDSDEEEDDYAGSESSEDLDVRKGKSHKSFGPIRRSTRARISRYDRDFINDDTDSDGAGPRRKKNRSIWEESESEESDRSWGRRKRRAAAARKKALDKPKRSKKKKKKHGDDSDPEVFKKRPNIKFGGLNDDEEVGRRTRGKKINYLEALGTDSDDDVRRKPPRIEESDDEYAVHEDEELQQRLQNDNDSDESGVENVLRDLPLPLNPRPKPKGRGKAGLKIPRKPKDPGLDLFPLMPDLPPNPTMMQNEMPVLQQALESQPLLLQQMIPPPLIMDSLVMQEHESQDLDDEPNPIEQINKNVEQMNEQEMEKMMEEEDYANRQLQLVALQIEKEKKRKEREVQRLEKLMQVEPKIPKKRGRKPKNQMLAATTNLMPPFNEPALLLSNNAELSEPPGVSLPMFSELAPTLNADGSPKKRRGRGKGKKTLAAEAAAAAASNKIIDMEIGLEGPNSSSSNTVSPAPDSPMHGSKLGIAAPPQPFSQSQPTPSVITRMLQSQPGQTNFPPGVVTKYFSGPGNDPQLGPYHPGGGGPRGPYQQQSPGIPHFPVIRSGPPPLRLHSPGAPNLPPMYHAHRSLDPSPSGGGPINVPNTNRDRQSPSVPSPSSPSQLSKGDPTPPPYTRPPVGHFPPVSSNNTPGAPRPLPLVPPHLQQHRPANMTQFHGSIPPNYHYGSYPPPPPLTSDEGQSSPNYPAPPYSEQYTEGGAPIQSTDSPTAPVAATTGVASKAFDEGDEGGEFVALVSYFSSQREDDLDT